MTDYVPGHQIKQMMIIEALEHYIQRLKEDALNKYAIEAFTDLLSEIREEGRDVEEL